MDYESHIAIYRFEGDRARRLHKQPEQSVVVAEDSWYELGDGWKEAPNVKGLHQHFETAADLKFLDVLTCGPEGGREEVTAMLSANETVAVPWCWDTKSGAIRLGPASSQKTGKIVGDAISWVPRPDTAQDFPPIVDMFDQNRIDMRKMRSGELSVASYVATVRSIDPGDPDHDRILYTSHLGRTTYPVMVQITPLSRVAGQRPPFHHERVYSHVQMAGRALGSFGSWRYFEKAKDVPSWDGGNLYTTRSVSPSGAETWEQWTKPPGMAKPIYYAKTFENHIHYGVLSSKQEVEGMLGRQFVRHRLKGGAIVASMGGSAPVGVIVTLSANASDLGRLDLPYHQLKFNKPLPSFSEVDQHRAEAAAEKPQTQTLWQDVQIQPR